jgi:hypothetical protein
MSTICLPAPPAEAPPQEGPPSVPSVLGTPDDLLAWLSELAPDDVCGYRRERKRCPLARFLDARARRAGVPMEVSVDESAYYLDAQRYPMPLWARLFVLRVDQDIAHPHSSVRAQQALRYLHEALAEVAHPRYAPPYYDTPIEALDLSPRAYNSLKRAGVSKVGEVLEMTEEDLLYVRNFGRKSLDELRHRLILKGFITPERAQEQFGGAYREDDEFEEDQLIECALPFPDQA